MPCSPLPSFFRYIRIAAALLLTAVSVVSQGLAATGREAPLPVGPYLNGAFPATPPGNTAQWRTVRAFPNLTFTDPMWLTPWPGTDDLLIVERVGRLKRIPNQQTATPEQVTTVLDWTGRTQTVYDDQGFYSAVFHPKFNDSTDPKRFLFLVYCHQLQEGTNTTGPSYWRLTRLEFDAAGEVMPGSETVLISLYDPSQWHNGGAMFFGDDGFLYLSNGDGGDWYGIAQALDKSLFSCVIRIDVDQTGGEVSHPIRRQPGEIVPLPPGVAASYTQNYYIPSDNPWVDQEDPPEGTPASRLEEIYATGLRSPHAMHYDSPTGQVWIGDVGDASREEIDMFVLDPENPAQPGKGYNFGWYNQEGMLGPELSNLSPGIPTRPVHDYPRSVGTCVIGGFIYRGENFSSILGGKLLFGDNRSGRLWTLSYEPGQPADVKDLTTLSDGNTLLGGDVAGLTNICRDQAGEPYFLYAAGPRNPNGKIYMLEHLGASPEPPALLSETGAFSDVTTLAPAPFMLPFAVNSPLWSDAAVKDRWIALPNDGSHDTPEEQITFSESGNWVFPAGTVLVKHFALPVDANNPAAVVPLETRFIVCLEEGGKYGVTYRWYPDGSDAYLLTEGETGDYPVLLADGSTVTQTWQFPSRVDCMSCHNSASGQALGVRTHQLNRDYLFPDTGETDNQLRTWGALGMFNVALEEDQIASFLRSAPLDAAEIPLEHRVRSYLDSNCSHCHRPGAQGPAFDARLTTPLAGQQLVNEALRPDVEGRFDLIPDSDEDAQIVPGHPELSAVHFRLCQAQPNSAAMPPLAKNLVDSAAVDALTQWINALPPAEFEDGPAHQARYVRFTGLNELNGNPWSAVSELTILDNGGVFVPHGEISVAGVSSEEIIQELSPATNAIDGDPATNWVTRWGYDVPSYPHWIELDLGSTREVGGFVFLPRTSLANAVIKDWRLETSNDGSTWSEIGSGTFPYANGPGEERVAGLRNPRPVRALVGAPSRTSDPVFTATVVFDHAVNDFTADDFVISNGTVESVHGNGYYYTAVIRAAAAGITTVQVPANAVNADKSGSFASQTVEVGITIPVEVIEPLIGSETYNGSFELYDVAEHTNVSTGEIPFWTTWVGQSTWPAECGIYDSVEAGSQVLTLDAGGAVKNMTPHGIGPGDRFDYQFENMVAGLPEATMMLVYEDNGEFHPIPGTEVTGGPVAIHSGTFTAALGDPWLGKKVGVGLLSAGDRPQIDNVQLIVTIPDDYGTWSNNNLPSPNPAQASLPFDEDQDLDGLANGLEWILGGNPLVSEPNPLLAQSADEGEFSISFRRLKSSIARSTLMLEWDTDLEDGFAHSFEIGTANTTDPESGIEVSVVDQEEFLLITIRIPAAEPQGGPRLFVRLKGDKT